MLAVKRIEVYNLKPFLVLATGVKELGDIEARPALLNMSHEAFLPVLAVADTELGVYSLVCTLELDSGLQYFNQLVKIPKQLVLLTKLHEVIGVHNDMHSAALSELELLGVDTRETHFFPNRDLSSVVGSIDSVLELLEVHVAKGKLGVVLDVLVDDFGGKIEFLFEEAPTNIGVLGVVLGGQEILELAKLLRFGIRVYEFVVKHRIL
mmetsp:Transcript_25407/g.40130  ORF Transcript_25407/g.40130 Transcript_25407/m.40130 type:complete len:208 (-) Transcript_25407:2351-2974(-)